MEYDIVLTNGARDPQTSCSHGDKLEWTNNTNHPLTLNLPTCVSPQNGPVSLANGQTSGAYTANNGANGRYTYSYMTAGPEKGTRNGTIDVG